MNTISVNPKFEKFLEVSIFLSLLSLALGAVTSVSVMSLSHIFMVIPILYFLPKADYKNFPKSAWALLAFAIVLVLSVVVNQDVIANGYKFAFKTKYFFFGFFSIAPLSWYFKERVTTKQIQILIYSLLIITVVSTLSGIVTTYTGKNPLSGGIPWVQVRNSGLMRNVMNYAHNMSFILIFLFWMIINKKKSQEFVNFKILLICAFVNLIGFYLTYTRGAWIGFIAGFSFLYIHRLSSKKLIILFILSFLSLSSAYFLAGSKMKRHDGDESRIGLWKAALYMAKERPLFGFGYLNYEKHTESIKSKYGLEVPNMSGLAHNSHLEILASASIVGVISYLSWLFFLLKESMFKSIFKPLKLASFFCFLAGGLTQSTIALGVNLFLILLIFVFINVDYLNSKNS